MKIKMKEKFIEHLEEDYLYFLLKLSGKFEEKNKSNILFLDFKIRNFDNYPIETLFDYLFKAEKEFSFKIKKTIFHKPFYYEYDEKIKLAKLAKKLNNTNPLPDEMALLKIINNRFNFAILRRYFKSSFWGVNEEVVQSINFSIQLTKNIKKAIDRKIETYLEHFRRNLIRVGDNNQFKFKKNNTEGLSNLRDYESLYGSSLNVGNKMGLWMKDDFQFLIFFLILEKDGAIKIEEIKGEYKEKVVILFENKKDVPVDRNIMLKIKIKKNLSKVATDLPKKLLKRIKQKKR